MGEKINEQPLPHAMKPMEWKIEQRQLAQNIDLQLLSYHGLQ